MIYVHPKRIKTQSEWENGKFAQTNKFFILILGNEWYVCVFFDDWLSFEGLEHWFIGGMHWIDKKI